jgi:SAM-dependent methyltransferase
VIAASPALRLEVAAPSCARWYGPYQMSSAEGARTFRVAGSAYDTFMGRYSRPLAAVFAEAAGVAAGQRVLDIGCGPGALTEELVRRVGASAVTAIDPSQPFVEACARKNAGVDVRLGAAETLPFADASFDNAIAQLVLHFVSDPAAAAAEMRRVLRPVGSAAACVWDFTGGMEMLRLFWDAALAIDPSAPDEPSKFRFGRDGEIGSLFTEARLRNVVSGALTVEVGYEGFDDFWAGFLTGTGPSGSFCVSLEPQRQEALREDLRRRLGDPSGPFALTARAWYAVGRA